MPDFPFWMMPRREGALGPNGCRHAAQIGPKAPAKREGIEPNFRLPAKIPSRPLPPPTPSCSARRKSI